MGFWIGRWVSNIKTQQSPRHGMEHTMLKTQCHQAPEMLTLGALWGAEPPQSGDLAEGLAMAEGAGQVEGGQARACAHRVFRADQERAAPYPGVA